MLYRCFHRGNRPCITCKNLINIRGHDTEALVGTGMVGLDCAQRDLLEFHTNESVFAMADRLEAAVAAGQSVERLQTDYGLKYNPYGFMFDKDLRRRGVYKPVSNYIRDWMHVVVNAGVPNTHIAMLLHVLAAVGNITPDVVADAILEYKLPKKWGRVQRNWITENRLKDDTLNSFASTILALVTIILSFLNEHVKPLNMLGDHITCFSLLNDILDILRLGAERSMEHVDRLRRLIDMHAKLFVLLYPSAEKPKFHHMFHIICNMRWLGKLLSCFVTERKHRSSKSSALYVFRGMESTVLTDQINKMCEMMAEENCALFKRTTCLGALRHNVAGHHLFRSASALLECGVIKPGDIVWLNNDIVGEVVCFWSKEEYATDEFLVEINAYDAVTIDGEQFFDKSTSRSHLANSCDIVDACIWIYKRESIIKVLVPFASRVDHA